MTTSDRRPVAVITGASSGIGKEAAKALAEQGWFVIGLGRNPERCARAKEDIDAVASGTAQVEMICADLALMSEARRAAGEIAAMTPRVDALLNNAGGLTRELTLTAEGNENTFASNHLGHFMLTQSVMPLLENAAADSPVGKARVVNVSSLAHQACEGLDWDDLQSIDNFSSTPAYCRAKLANILFTRELAKRLDKEKIVAHAMHPGQVDSNFGSYGDDAMQHYLQANADKAISSADAADTLVWLASAPEPAQSTGQYFFQREAMATSDAAMDEASAERLWQESERLAGATPAV